MFNRKKQELKEESEQKTSILSSRRGRPRQELSPDMPQPPEPNPKVLKLQDKDLIEEAADYYAKTYSGSYMPQDFASAHPALFQAEQLNLLYSIMQELRKLREAMDNE